MSAVAAAKVPAVIELVNVSKAYRRYGGRHFATLKSALLQRSLLRDLRPSDILPALRDVSFSVPRGSTFGVVGRNGSGKSTALKLVAGITKPTSGRVIVRGRISALIELGAGFHPEISGRENIFINGIMLGLTKREVQRRFDEIVEFAELREFIDAPVKTYSSGMYMRLGFSVAIHVDPEVLLVDEVLAVGDEGFTHKCLDKFGEFKRRGRTILLVSHSLGLVERFCDEAVWLDAGQKRAQGDPKRVVGAYVTDVERQEEQFLAASDAKTQHVAGTGEKRQDSPLDAGEAATDMSRAAEGRWGSGGVEITDVRLQNDQGQTTHVFHSGEPLTLRLQVHAVRPTTDFVFGVGIFNAEGVCVYGTNTDIEEHRADKLDGTAEITLVIEALDLVEGTYKLDVAVHRLDGAPYDYHRLLYTFRVKSRLKDVGIYRPRHHWEFSGGVKFKRTV
jgi:ABC-type polysaccharide/polyol phosphate transport system ATPase subunit